MTTIAELIAKWETGEGKPYRGSLIDMDAYRSDPSDIGCMCAQGQVLHLIGGWETYRLYATSPANADAETANILNISRAHAALLRIVNDKSDGAPAAVLTDPARVLGDRWSRLLDFWHYIDGMTKEEWVSAGVTAWDAAMDAARVSAMDAAMDAAGDAARDAAGDAARGAARDAAWDAASVSNEIQGADILRAKGIPLFFLPAFGFADPSEIPSRPADYGIIK